MEIRKKLREEHGEVSLHLSIILLVGVLLISTAIQVHHVYGVFGLAKAKTNEAVLAVAAHNVSEMYGGVRESAGTARRYRSGMWNSTVSTADVLQALIVSLDAVPHGMGLLVPDSFQLNRLDTRFINQEGTNLNFITTMEVEIPLSVGGGLLPPVRKTLEVRTTYEPKF